MLDDKNKNERCASVGVEGEEDGTAGKGCLSVLSVCLPDGMGIRWKMDRVWKTK